MTEDRRAWDPYAPSPARIPETGPEPAESPAVDTLPSDLDDLRKHELVTIAVDRGLDPSGTRADIIARLRDSAG